MKHSESVELTNREAESLRGAVENLIANGLRLPCGNGSSHLSSTPAIFPDSRDDDPPSEFRIRISPP